MASHSVPQGKSLTPVINPVSSPLFDSREPHFLPEELVKVIRVPLKSSHGVDRFSDIWVNRKIQDVENKTSRIKLMAALFPSNGLPLRALPVQVRSQAGLLWTARERRCRGQGSVTHCLNATPSFGFL